MTHRYTGIYQTDYTLDADAQTVTFPLGTGAAAGDVLRVRYPYRRGVPLLGPAPSPVAIGTASSTATNVSMPLPLGWLSGDLVVVSATAWTTASTTDPRLTNSVALNAANGVWWGHLDVSGNPITLAMYDQYGSWGACVMAVYRGVTVAESLTSTGSGYSHPAPQFASAAAVVVANGYQSGTVGPSYSETDATGEYASVKKEVDGRAMTSMRLWTAGTFQQSPAGAFHHDGTAGDWACAALRLVAA